MTPASALLLALGACALATAPTDARPEFVARLPNGANVPGVDAIGHVNTEGGGERNQFGKDFDAAGRKWTAALCAKDSDGDGQTNGEELGDPCCAFVAGSNEKVLWKTGVSHPGDATKKADPALWASVSCPSGGGSSVATPAPNTTSTSGTPSTVATPAPTPTSGAVAVFTATALVVGAMLAFALA